MYRDYGEYIKKDLKFTFIDSWSQQDFNKNDALQQQKWKNNTDALYQFATQGPGLKLRTIEKVLKENRDLRGTINSKELINRNGQ